MDAYFPTTSPEYQAHVLIAYVQSNLTLFVYTTVLVTPHTPISNHQPAVYSEGVWWNPSIGPIDIGLCAAYAALSRYVKGEDLYLPPRNTSELQAIL